MMIEQRNARGGLLGRPIEPVIVNPHSDPKAYPALAKKLIHDDKVAALFGCWSSASRKEVLPIVEKENALLFYPSQYEGEETSRNIFYTGATPPQQAIPAVNFLRRRASAASSWSARTTFIRAPPMPCSKAIWRASASANARSATRRSTRPIGAQVVDDIRRFARGGNGDSKTAVVATVSGDANVHFFRELANQEMAARTSGDVALDHRGRAAGADALECRRPFRRLELSARLRHAGEPRLRRAMAAFHRHVPTRSPTIRWKPPGSAFISGRMRSRPRARPMSTRCARRLAGGASPHRPASRCWSTKRPITCSSRS